MAQRTEVRPGDVPSLQLEMWEIDPAGDGAHFVTAVSHLGIVSEDLKHISATWTTKTDGRLDECQQLRLP